MKNPVILAVDTSTKKLSMCLYKHGFYHKKNIHSKDHSNSLIKTFDRLLKETNTKLSDLTHIAVNTGPGSFTGLRVGLSFVKILAIYLKLKIIITASFGILINEFLEKNLEKFDNIEIITLFPSIKNEFYFCKFLYKKNSITQKTKPTYLNSQKIKKLLEKQKDIIVVAPVKIKELLNIKKVNFSSESIIKLFLEKKYKTLYRIIKPADLYPLYVRHTYY